MHAIQELLSVCLYDSFPFVRDWDVGFDCTNS